MSTEFVSPNWRMPRNANQSDTANYSLDFNGSNQYISSSPTLSGLTDVTVSCWAKFENINNNDFQYVLIAYNTSQSGSYRVGIGMIKSDYSTVSDRYKLYTIDGSNLNISSFVVSQDVWYNIVVTQSGTVRKLFVNGDLISTFTGVPSLNLGNNLEIGRFSNNNHYFPGKMDQVCIFDYALSESQVTTLYGTGSAIGNPMALPRTPIAYYPLGTSAWNGQYLAENNAIGDYVFNFSSDYIDCGNDNSLQFQPTDALTFSCWFNAASHSSNSIIVSNNEWTGAYRGYNLQLASTGVLKFTITSSYTPSNNYIQISSTTTISTGSWYHIVITKDTSIANTSLNMYINGSPASVTRASSGTLSTFTYVSSFNLGGADNGSQLFGGKISNAQVFNTELSSSDAETLYNYGSPIRTLANIPQNSNLKAWYKLDASEIYSISTEWEVENNANPSVYTQSTKLNGNSGSRIYLNPNTGGSTGGIILPNSFSFSFWINTTSTLNGYPSSGSVIEGSGGSTSSGGAMWNMFRYSNFNNGKWVIRLNSNFQGGTNGNVEVTSVINDGRWHHVLLTYDSSSTTLTVYTDNVQTYTLSTNNFGTGINVSRIGTSYDGNANSVFNGDLSNLSFWTGALTSSQRNEIYNNGTPKDLSTNSNYSNLLNWYKLNNDLQDSKGSNNGTGGSTTTKTFGFINTLAGESSGMSQSNLVQSDLQTVAPYSKYAMNFDAGDADYIDLTSQIVLTSELAISCWVKSDGAVVYGIVAGDNGSADSWYRFYPAAPGGNRVDIMIDGTSTEWNFANGGTPIQNGVWQHYLLKRDSSNKWTFYLDNVKYTTNQPTISGSFRVDTFCRIYSTAPRYFEGALSNMAIWNTSLSDSQVREVYNQGLPGNLNSFSGTAPIHWWQLGENSSYVSDWIFADEIGSINGEGQNIAETDLTNGVGTTANGVSTGMLEGSLVGDAPYSTANALSSGMAVTARGTDVP